MKRRFRISVIFIVVFSILFFNSMAGDKDTPHNSLNSWFSAVNDNFTETANNKNEDYMYLAQSSNDYIPDIKLLVSTDDGQNWSENLKNLSMGEPFYLLVEASVRVPGFWLRRFGAKEILCTIALPEDKVVNLNLQDSDTSMTAFSMSQTAESGSSGTLKIIGSVTAASAAGGAIGAVARGATGGIVGAAAMAGVVLIQFVYDKIIESSQNKKLNEFLSGNHNNIFNCYSFPIPTSPVSDNDLARGVQLRKITMVFKADPLQTGSQTIKIFFEKKVSDIYMKTYTMVVN